MTPEKWAPGASGVTWDRLMDDARQDARILGRRVRVRAVPLPPLSAEIMGARWAYAIDARQH